MTAFFFDPNRGTTAADIAAGLAVMFAPFTLIGPFAGPLIDRWHRQRIIVVSNLVRVGLASSIVIAVVAGAPVPLLYGLALVTLSVNRFLLAALTAGVPRIVPPEDLLTANAILPTLGTLAATAGGGIAGAAVALVAPHSSDNSTAIFALVFAAALFAAASWASTRIGKTTLGPQALLAGGELARRTADLAKELVQGIRHLRSRSTPFHALGVMATTRLFYGLAFVSGVLIAKQLWAQPGDTADALGSLTMLIGFSAVGFGLAALVTPMLAGRLSRQRWIQACLGVGALGQVVFSISSAKWALLTGAVITGFAVQAIKIAVDTIVQRDTDDDFRGRAFALYDVAYNVAFIASACVGALVLPDTGYSRDVMVVLALAYVVAAVVFGFTPSAARPDGATPASAGAADEA